VRLEKQVLIVNKLGLHARPATQLAKLANQFNAEVSIRQGEQVTSANSVLGLMLLESQQGKEITIIAEGIEADKALAAISDLISQKFNERE